MLPLVSFPRKREPRVLPNSHPRRLGSRFRGNDSKLLGDINLFQQLAGKTLENRGFLAVAGGGGLAVV